MKTVASLLVVSLLVLSCGSAEARYLRRAHYWYDAEQVAKQQRANMAERTHQQKELMESARLMRERDRISAASTVRNYPVKNKLRKDRSSALVHRNRKNGGANQPL